MATTQPSATEDGLSWLKNLIPQPQGFDLQSLNPFSPSAPQPSAPQHNAPQPEWTSPLQGSSPHISVMDYDARKVPQRTPIEIAEEPTFQAPPPELAAGQIQITKQDRARFQQKFGKQRRRHSTESIFQDSIKNPDGTQRIMGRVGSQDEVKELSETDKLFPVRAFGAVGQGRRKSLEEVLGLVQDGQHKPHLLTPLEQRRRWSSTDSDLVNSTEHLALSSPSAIRYRDQYKNLGPQIVLNNHFKNSKLFQKLDDGMLEEVISLMEMKHTPHGERFIHQGTHGTEMFFIDVGTINVQRKGHAVISLTSGAYVGEMAFMTRVKQLLRPDLCTEEDKLKVHRSASCWARSAARLLVLKPEKFISHFQERPEVLNSFIRSFEEVNAERQHQMDQWRAAEHSAHRHH